MTTTTAANTLQPAFVLHRRRYRESSLIVEFLTAREGRIAAVARGALRGRATLGNTLQPLVPLGIAWRGRGELHTLTRAETSGRAFDLAGERLYAVFYLNELVLRLTVPADPVVGLFELYAATLTGLAQATQPEPSLRRFECGLLERIGLGLNLATDAETGATIEAGLTYRYTADHGARVATPGRGEPGVEISGRALLALAAGEMADDATVRETKRLMRYVIDHHLEGRPLKARELFAAKRQAKQ